MVIYNIDDTELLDAIITASAEHEEELMKSDFIKFSFSTDVRMTLPVGAYIVFNGLKYRLSEPYQPSQESEAEFKYEPQFHHPKMWLGKVVFVFDTTDTTGKAIKQQVWDYNGFTGTLLQYVVDAINEAFGFADEDRFNYTVIGEVDNTVSVSFSNSDILSAISAIASACKDNQCEWHLDWNDKSLYFGQLAYNRGEETPVLNVGENVGKASVSTSNDGYYNVFRPEGSTRNMSIKAASGENVSTGIRLGLNETDYPDGKIYVSPAGETVTKAAFEASGVPTQTLGLTFDDVYPHVDLYAYNIRKRTRYLLDDSGKNVVDHYVGDTPIYKTYTVWYMRLAYPTIVGGSVTGWTDYTLDVDKQVLDGYKPMITFKANTSEGALSSSLAGQPTSGDGFEIVYHKADDINTILDDGSTVKAGDYRIVFVKQGENDMIVPTNEDAGLIPRGEATPSLKGNIVVLYNIAMGANEVLAAQKELLDKTKKEIARRFSDLNNYTVSSYPHVFEKTNPNLYVGQRVVFNNGGYQLTTRVTKLVTKLDYDFIQTITVGNQQIKGSISQLKEDVKTIMSGNFSGAGINQTQALNLIKNYVGSRFLSKLSPDTAQGVITFLEGIAIDGVTLTKVITSLSSKQSTDDAILTALAAYNRFLSKTENDQAKGIITFEQKSIHVGGAQFGSNFTGNHASGDIDPSAIGGMIDKDGRAELKSLKLHDFLEVPELRYNRVYIQVGPIWRAPGGGYIESVEIETDVNGNSTQYGVITLHLEDKDIGKVAIDDLCMGIYYNGMTLGSEEDYDAYGVADDSKGNFRYQGFFTTYFEVVQILDSGHNARFRYKLREPSDSWNFSLHPCPMMHFVAYGNRTDVTRQDSKYEALGYTRFLYGVNTWEFTAENIGAQFGRLENLSVHGVNMTGYSAYLNNIYMAGHLEQLKTAIESSANYTVDFSGYVDVITVDDAGNAIGGLYQLDADNQPYNYRINSAIAVRKNGTLLTLATDTAGKGTFKIYAEPVNCTCSVVNSTIYITSIANIKDGISGSADDMSFDYDAMRNMESCYVNVTIDCEGKTSIVKKFPVTIKHDSNPYVGADLSNEFSAVSWNTKTGNYIGLPITTDMQMWRNNEALDVTSVAVKDSTGNLLAKCPLADGETIIHVDGLTITATLEINGGTGKKVGHVEITSMSKDAHAVANYNITTTAVYAGISYERTLVHTVNKSTDTNVYRLVPSVGSVTGSMRNGAMTLDNTSVSCQVYCDSSDDNHYQMTPEQMNAAGLSLARVVNHKNGNTDPQPYTIGDDVTITQDITTVVFELNYNSAIYATETIPVLLEGVDGNGVEYVFLWKDDYDESADNKPSLYDESTKGDYQADGFLPTDNTKLIQWHDEPNGVGLNHPYEFYAQRKFVNGLWQPFGEVKLWSKYPINSSPYILDLTNDNQTVPCDAEGNPISYQPSEFILFYGAEKISDFTDWEFLLEGNNVGYDNTLWDPQTGKYTIMPTGLSSASGTLVLTLTNKNNATIVLKATMSMAKATAGADAVVYSLAPEGSVIHRNMDGTYDATSYTVNVKMTSGTTTSLLTTKEDLTNKGLELWIGDNAMTDMSFSLGADVGTKKSVVVTLKHDNSVVDQETIYVVSDGKKGTDASAYHLTSDIGTLTRDGDGAIKETLPTIGGYVKTGDGDDISVTTGYTIVAEEKDDAGKVLVSHTSENGQLAIPSVNDGTTHIVVNMYDASNPGVPICPSQDIPVTKPLKGDRGFSGCLQRINKVYAASHTYRNDASLDGDGIHYIDYMVVKDDSLASGWRVYQCIDTHTASATFNDDKAHWTEVGINAVSAFFTYLIAKNASVELLSGSSFVIVENDIPVSGLSNGDIPLWIGAMTADKTTAPFYVDKYGSMKANDANLTGLISEGMRQFNRNSFVPINLSSVKSVSLDSYSGAYGVDSVLGSSAYVKGTVILPCSEGTALGYYKSDADGTVKEYTHSTPSYLKAGTHLSVRNGNGTGYNMWAMLGSQVDAWSNNSALYNLLNHCVLVCADPRVFSLDHQYKLGSDGTYTRSDVAVKACGEYPTNTLYEYNHGCFSANGMRARFILLPPSQALQLISSVERFETYAGGVTGYDNALVWNVLNASDFSPMWCNVQEMLDETVKTGPTRMLTNNYSGDNFDIDAENGFSTYTDAFLVSKAIATNIGGLNPTLKNITFSIKLYSSPADANSGNTPTWDVTVADA